jgi:hypothetical protein
MNLVTMTVYVDLDTYCWVQNIARGGLEPKWETVKTGSLRRTRKCKYELQIPIEIILQVKRKRVVLHLYTLYQIHECRMQINL